MRRKRAVNFAARGSLSIIRESFFHVVTNTELEILHPELSERKVDLLISRRWGLFTEEKFDFEILYDDSPVVVAGVQSPWVRRRRIALTELVNGTWLLPPPERALGPIYLEAFRASRLIVPTGTPW
jgi:DNA-binding transcriptional LysR family regulator